MAYSYARHFFNFILSLTSVTASYNVKSELAGQNTDIGTTYLLVSKFQVLKFTNFLFITANVCARCIW